MLDQVSDYVCTSFKVLKLFFARYDFPYGRKLFEAFNNTFDLLPLVCILEESIYCAHGGIPCSLDKIEDINKIPSPLPDPESQSKAAWEVRET